MTHVLFLFTRFLGIPLCVLIPKPFVCQHIQVRIFLGLPCRVIALSSVKRFSVQGHQAQARLWIWNCSFLSSVEKLQSMCDEEWTVFLSQLCSSLEEQSTANSVLSPASPTPSTTIRSKLNLLCYLCCVVGHKAIANKLINSKLVGKHIFTYFGEILSVGMSVFMYMCVNWMSVWCGFFLLQSFSSSLSLCSLYDTYTSHLFPLSAKSFTRRVLAVAPS